MKVVWNTCEKKLRGTKSGNENCCKKFSCRITKATPYKRNLGKIRKKNQ